MGNTNVSYFQFILFVCFLKRTGKWGLWRTMQNGNKKTPQKKSTEIRNEIKATHKQQSSQYKHKKK